MQPAHTPRPAANTVPTTLCPRPPVRRRPAAGDGPQRPGGARPAARHPPHLRLPLQPAPECRHTLLGWQLLHGGSVRRQPGPGRCGGATQGAGRGCAAGGGWGWRRWGWGGGGEEGEGVELQAGQAVGRRVASVFCSYLGCTSGCFWRCRFSTCSELPPTHPPLPPCSIPPLRQV